jgi:hypothetical protein
MQLLRTLRARWKARRLQLAVNQMAAGEAGTGVPTREGKAAAFSRMTKSQSHTEWRGD